MSNKSTLARLFELAIAAEKAAEELYRGLEAKFAHHEDVADFWREYAGEEVMHAAWLERLRDSLAPERLSAPADPDVMDYVSETIATLPDRQCRFLSAGDVDGDGKPELIAAAYKSGLWMIKPKGQEWAIELIDKDSGGYEHATVLADMDGDGVLEIYAAADDQQQLRRYRWTGEKFERTDLFTLPKGNITFGLMPCLEAKYFTVR